VDVELGGDMVGELALTDGLVDAVAGVVGLVLGAADTARAPGVVAAPRVFAAPPVDAGPGADAADVCPDGERGSTTAGSGPGTVPRTVSVR
jgi:hypothetical protein